MGAVNDTLFDYLNIQGGLLGTDPEELLGFSNPEAFTKVGGVPTDPDYKNANGDYSAKPNTWRITASELGDKIIRQIQVYVEDSGSIDSGRYGNNIILTNGVQFRWSLDGIIIAEPVPILKNVDFLRAFNGALNVYSFGAGNEAIRANMDLTISEPIVLRKGSTDYIEFELNDDFTGLVNHFFTAFGSLRMR